MKSQDQQAAESNLVKMYLELWEVPKKKILIGSTNVVKNDNTVEQMLKERCSLKFITIFMLKRQ